MLEALLDRFTTLASAGAGRTHGVVRHRRNHTRARRLFVTTIFPAGSAYRGEHVQLDLPVLEPGRRPTVAAPDGIEAVLVCSPATPTIASGIDARVERRRRVRRARDRGVPPAGKLDRDHRARRAPSSRSASTVGGDLHARR